MSFTLKLKAAVSKALRYLLPLVVLPGLLPSLAMASDDVVGALQSAGTVLMIRHAEAPGTGDPAGFRLDDCSTQRNLSEGGRQQAKVIGDWLRAQGIEQARVYSSQWCRCLDTARLMAVGDVKPLPGLNNFYQRPQDREPNLAALRRFLDQQPRDGGLLVLVTHQVTINGLTGEYTPSGHGVLLRLEDGGGYSLVGKLDFRP
jgi:broad specificity phosphatase PhoE